MTSDRDAPFARSPRRLRSERGLSVRAVTERARYGKPRWLLDAMHEAAAAADPAA